MVQVSHEIWIYLFKKRKEKKEKKKKKEGKAEK